MRKAHHWEPIYKSRTGDKKLYLYGICAHCKQVRTGEELMRWLNKYEDVCKELGIEVELEKRDGE